VIDHRIPLAQDAGMSLTHMAIAFVLAVLRKKPDSAQKRDAMPISVESREYFSGPRFERHCAPLKDD